jgi:hypothetical protein
MRHASAQTGEQELQDTPWDQPESVAGRQDLSWLFAVFGLLASSRSKVFPHCVRLTHTVQEIDELGAGYRRGIVPQIIDRPTLVTYGGHA